MSHAQFGAFLVAYAFIVGHFNFGFALAAAFCMLVTYVRHNGRLRDRL